MAASYPTTPKTFTPIVDGTDFPQADDINVAYDEIAAVEGALLNGLAHPLRFAAAVEVTIASGAVTVSKGYNRIDTEGDAATDDLETITAGTNVGEGSVIVLRAEDVARVVTLKDGTGNLLLAGDYALSATDRTITLIYDGTNWREIARSTAGVEGITSGSGTVTQIAFNATQSASADPNTLDDYEEGTWTPVIGGSSGTSGQTYGTQAGHYTKKGREVTLTFVVTLSAKGTITGSVEIQGLPFPPANSQATAGGWMFQNLATNWIAIGCRHTSATALLVQGIQAAAATNFTALTTSDIGNTSAFRGHITYFV